MCGHLGGLVNEAIHGSLVSTVVHRQLIIMAPLPIIIRCPCSAVQVRSHRPWAPCMSDYSEDLSSTGTGKAIADALRSWLHWLNPSLEDRVLVPSSLSSGFYIIFVSSSPEPHEYWGGGLIHMICLGLSPHLQAILSIWGSHKGEKALNIIILKLQWPNIFFS